MKWDKVGSFCSRDVLTARLEELNLITGIETLCDSTLLVVLKSEVSTASTLESLFRCLAEANPLVISLLGKNAGVAFGILLEVLSHPIAKDHIMTKICYGETFQEGLEDFLESSWPTEERHDNWTFCRILVVDNEENYCFFVHQLKKMLT